MRLQAFAFSAVGCLLLVVGGCDEEAPSDESVQGSEMDEDGGSEEADGGGSGEGGAGDLDDDAPRGGSSQGEPSTIPQTGGAGGVAEGSGGTPGQAAGGASGGEPSTSSGAGGRAVAAEGDATGAGGSEDGGAPPSAGGAGGESETMDPVPVDGDPVAVAVGYGMRRVSSRNGLDWEYFEESTPDGGDDDDLFRGLSFGAGRFVAVGGSGMSLSQVSTDGQTWDVEDRGQGAWLGGVAFLDGEFVAAGGNGLRVHSEDLGSTWLDSVGYEAIHYRDVASGEGLVVAVGHTYNESPDVGVIAITEDGRAWEQVVFAGDNLSRVAFGNGVFVAAGGNGRVSWSDDGMDWNDATQGEGDGSVVFVNSEFVLSNGGGVFRSGDGSGWTMVDGAGFGVEGYIDGVYLSLGWPAVIRASSDMVEWEPVFEPGGSGFTRIVTGYVE